jgi:hypothetical protein
MPDPTPRDLRRAFRPPGRGGAGARRRPFRRGGAVAEDGRCWPRACPPRARRGAGRCAFGDEWTCAGVIAAAVPREAAPGDDYSRRAVRDVRLRRFFYTGWAGWCNVSRGAILPLRNGRPHTAGLSSPAGRCWQRGRYPSRWSGPASRRRAPRRTRATGCRAPPDGRSSRREAPADEFGRRSAPLDPWRATEHNGPPVDLDYQNSI